MRRSVKVKDNAESNESDHFIDKHVNFKLKAASLTLKLVNVLWVKIINENLNICVIKVRKIEMMRG